MTQDELDELRRHAASRLSIPVMPREVLMELLAVYDAAVEFAEGRLGHAYNASQRLIDRVRESRP